MHHDFDSLARACADTPDDPAAWAAFTDYLEEQAGRCGDDADRRGQLLLVVAGVRYAAANDLRPVRSGPIAWTVPTGGAAERPVYRTWLEAVAALGQVDAIGRGMAAAVATFGRIAGQLADGFRRIGEAVPTDRPRRRRGGSLRPPGLPQ